MLEPLHVRGEAPARVFKRHRAHAGAAVLRALEQAGARVLSTFEHDDQCTDDAGAVEL